MSPEDERRMECLVPIDVVASERRVYERLIKGLLRFERTDEVGEGTLPIEIALEGAASEMLQLRELFASKGLKINAKTMEGIMLYQGYEYWLAFLETELFKWALTASPSRLKGQIARRPMMLIPHLTEAKKAYDAVMGDPEFEWLHSAPSLAANAAIDHGEKAMAFFEDTAKPTFQAVTSEARYSWIAGEKGFLSQMCMERPHQIRGLLEWAEGEVAKIDTDPKYTWIVGERGGQKSLLAKQLIKAPKAFEARMAEAKSVYEEMAADPNLIFLFGGKSLMVRAALLNPKHAKKQVEGAGEKFKKIIEDPSFAWLVGVSGAVRAVRYQVLEKLMFGASIKEVTEELSGAEFKFDRALALVRNKGGMAELKADVERRVERGVFGGRQAAQIRRWLQKMMKLKLTPKKTNHLKAFYLYLVSVGVDYPPELILAHSAQIPKDAYKKVEKLLELGFNSEQISGVIRSNVQVLARAPKAIEEKFRCLEGLGLNPKKIFVKHGIVLSQSTAHMTGIHEALCDLCQNRAFANEILIIRPEVFMLSKRDLEKCLRFVVQELTGGDLDEAIEMIGKNPRILCVGRPFETMRDSAMGIIGHQGNAESARKVFTGNPWCLKNKRSYNDQIYEALAAKRGVQSAAAYMEYFPGILSSSPDEVRDVELGRLLQLCGKPIQSHRRDSFWRDYACSDSVVVEGGDIYSMSGSAAFDEFYASELAAFI